MGKNSLFIIRIVKIKYLQKKRIKLDPYLNHTQKSNQMD